MQFRHSSKGMENYLIPVIMACPVMGALCKQAFTPERAFTLEGAATLEEAVTLEGAVTLERAVGRRELIFSQSFRIQVPPFGRCATSPFLRSH